MTKCLRRDTLSGLTLVEVLVALMVFAVIGVAAFAMLDQTLRSDRIATARLERLGEVQRVMQIMAIDTVQAVPGTLQLQPDGISFLRRGRMLGGVEGLVVAYRLAEGSLWREIGPASAAPVRQVVTTGVAGIVWRFHAAGLDWQAAVPGPEVDGVEMVLTLAAGETLRRVFVLPQDVFDPVLE
ncbi:MAG: type II secretion system protein GspJ [bacterium]